MLTEKEQEIARRQKAIDLAARLMKEAGAGQTRSERAFQKRLSLLVSDSKAKAFTLAVADQCFRATSAKRTADQFLYLLKKYGAPVFAKSLGIFSFLGKGLTSFFIPSLQKRLQKESAKVIVTGTQKTLLAHIKERYKEGFRTNLNHLGESVHGEQEAYARLQVYLNDLKQPEIEYISVKVSTIYSQLNLINWDDTVFTLSDRLKELYRASMEHTYERPDGALVYKFVNLDMEEYRDLHLTVEAFCGALDDPEFLECAAGIALQAYLPDSYAVLEKLTAWAEKRVANGGAPIKVRLVKGANQAMELVDASLHGWPSAPYQAKAETDANFRRMLRFACQHAKAVHIGIGSHNIFDIAYGLVLREEYGAEDFIKFEMLEGMADPICRAVKKVSKEMLLYCPAVEEKDFENAIAYLTRRLDENTAPDNFLRHSFDLKVGDKNWEKQVEQFNQIADPSTAPRRSQNRELGSARPAPSNRFKNEPDTDWSLPANRKWADRIFSEWKDKTSEPVASSLKIQAPEKSSVFQRAELLEEAAQGFREGRKKLIGTMVREAFKTVAEADAEISEAIDFIDYYRRMLLEFARMEDIAWSPKGIVLVAPPWNFPCSIPVGGVAAALAAGNSVILKPAPQTPQTGALVAQIFWEAGVSKELLSLAILEDEAATELILDPRISTVILTGSTETAEYFKKIRPGIDLIAETGGKNSIIVTALADRDLAISSVVASAFGYAGQKCSACSLLILEDEVYTSEKFKRQLKDAAASLPVGSEWNKGTKVNRLIQAPSEKLLRALTTLEPGEEWLLEPKEIEPNLWSPGIKYGVSAGSFTHQTEFFGPVLGVMRAKDLAHAIQLANGTPYGLTAGIQTLDEREQKYWVDHIQAGNCYINRTITGAIVQRQPFGGCKASSFGRGAKAGGPNYLLQLMHARQIASPKGSYDFSKDYDLSQVVGQENIFRYVPREKMAFLVSPEDAPADVQRVVEAAKACKTKLELFKDEDVLLKKIEAGVIDRVRTIQLPSEALCLSKAHLHVGAPLASNRIEFLHYLREVSISRDYHRYGNLGEKLWS